jgi:hypothetical protein
MKLRLIWIPAVISLLITVMRVAGELLHWSPRWFSSDTGGTVPASAVSWVIGITWLALPFGAYFAYRLSADGLRPHSTRLWVLLALAGLLIIYGSPLVLVPLLRTLPIGFPRILLIIWLYMVVAAALQYFAWPALFKVLLAYGVAARLPVVIVMSLAMAGGWGTHYDYVGMPPQFSMPLIPRFLWLAFFPQLVFWVAFTIAAGSIGGLAGYWVSLRKPATGSPR